ncbi:MAG TPA: DnaJ family molecular chaperone [Beijerinckiaceae bacterium]|nr:DnaJ family molecular chaperone [Beijerinckiaceae bacterium]
MAKAAAFSLAGLPCYSGAMVSVWGKLGGAGLGYALGGPLGALLGGFAGHMLVDREGALFGPPPRDVIFTTGLVALSAKMARADGVVLPVEVEAFRRFVEVPPEEHANVLRLFRLAQETSEGFEAYARQIASAFAEEPKLLEDVLDGLFGIATADGAVHQNELGFVREVAAIFGFSAADFERIAARHVRDAADPYVILGAERGMSGEELKRRYRELAAENHPDRAIARGLPPEAVAIATGRLAAINAAFDRVAAERGLA